jgi:hypothetical protein
VTWTFDDTADPISAKDQVRLLVGDTDTSDQQLTDEVIEFYLDDQGNSIDLAAAEAADALAAKFARQVDTKNSRLSVAASKRLEHYHKLAARLRERASTAAAPFFGGQSRQGKIDLELDEDNVQPRFRRGEHGSDRFGDDHAPRWWNRN